MIKHIPNSLTLGRLALLPVIVVLGLAESNSARWAMLAVFCLAAATDYIDGYLARRYGACSVFGRIFDPIADKLLVATILVLLLAQGSFYGWHSISALLVMLREILVAGLRAFVVEMGQHIPVTSGAKFKTMIQMVALALLIAATAGGTDWLLAGQLGLGLFWLAAILTLWTGYEYLKITLRLIRTPKSSATSARTDPRTDPRTDI